MKIKRIWHFVWGIQKCSKIMFVVNTPHKYTKKLFNCILYCFGHFKWVNYMVCELCFNKAITKTNK